MSGARRPVPRRRRGSLVAVGTGITGISQVTVEAIELMRSCDRLYHCVIEPLVEAWLTELNRSATSLAPLYADGKPRHRTYREMSRLIVADVRRGRDVVVAFYGHPGVLVYATHQAIRTLRREGFAARMTPGVSTEACFYADLGIDPGRVGVQSFEATDFLMYRRRFDPTSILLLWQVGVLGERDSHAGHRCRPERAQYLVSKLASHYPAAHKVALYQAATFPGDQPSIRWTRLRDLAKVEIPPMQLLYVPPAAPRTRYDRRVVAWLHE